MEPITEHRPVAGPVVYGYLRMPAPNAARRAALTAALAGYCDRHELVLAAVFTDHNDDDRVLTPAFVGLMDALAAEGYGVVLPSLAHLGGPPAAAERSTRIAATGGRLMLVRGGPARRTAEHRSRPHTDYRGPRDARHQ